MRRDEVTRYLWDEHSYIQSMTLEFLSRIEPPKFHLNVTRRSFQVTLTCTLIKNIDERIFSFYHKHLMYVVRGNSKGET